MNATLRREAERTVESILDYVGFDNSYKDYHKHMQVLSYMEWFAKDVLKHARMPTADIDYEPDECTCHVGHPPCGYCETGGRTSDE